MTTQIATQEQLDDLRAHSWGAVQRRERTEQTEARLRERLRTRSARAIYLAYAGRSPELTDREFRYLAALFSWAGGDLTNCFPGPQKILARMGGRRLGRHAKNEKHSKRAVMRRLAQLAQACVAKGWLVRHAEGMLARMPAGVIGAEPWTGTADFSRRAVAPRTRRHP